MTPGDKAMRAIQKLLTGRNIIRRNDIPTPVINKIKSKVVNNPNLSILFFEFAGIKYEFI